MIYFGAVRQPKPFPRLRVAVALAGLFLAVAVQTPVELARIVLRR